jgi:hypothetical protein
MPSDDAFRALYAPQTRASSVLPQVQGLVHAPDPDAFEADDAARVDPHQHLDRGARPRGHLGGRDARVEPPGSCPAGIVELDEDPRDTVRREVLEETGVTVEPLRLTGVYKNMRLGVVSMVFRCRPLSGWLGRLELAALGPALKWPRLDRRGSYVGLIRPHP